MYLLYKRIMSLIVKMSELTLNCVEIILLQKNMKTFQDNGYKINHFKFICTIANSPR